MFIFNKELVCFGDSTILVNAGLASSNKKLKYMNEDSVFHKYMIDYFNSTPSNVRFILGEDSSFTPSKKYSLTSIIDYFSLSLFGVNYSGFDSHTDSNRLLFNSMGLSKQLRWLEKNSLVSETLTLSNDKYVNTKRLMEANLYDSRVSNTNLSVSNIFSEDKLNFNIDNFSISNKDIFSNYNNFEESRDFIQKRYLYSINHSNSFISRYILRVKESSLVGEKSSDENYLVLRKNFIDYLLIRNSYLGYKSKYFKFPINLGKSRVLGFEVSDFTPDSVDIPLTFNNYLINLDSLNNTDSYTNSLYMDCSNINNFPTKDL
jgi:hypothetical protein